MVVIGEAASEESRRVLRRMNDEEMKESHQWGAERLLTGIPKDCKVEQPRAQQEHISIAIYKTGDQQFTNGLLRICYINGVNRKEYHIGFAGRARTQAEMNSGEGEFHQWG
jgi:hypothetical protein